MLSDLKFALRSLLKTPVFTLVAVLTLALGIGANSGVLSFLNVLLFRPLPLPGVQQLVFMGEYSQQVPNMSVSYPNFTDWRDRQQSFTALGAFRGQSFNYVGPTESERLNGALFSADMFRVLGVAPRTGRWFNADEDKPGAERVAVVSERFWQTSLGARADVLGAKITLSGEIYSIVGVMPSDFRVPTNNPDVWVPLGLNADTMQDRGSHPGLYCIGRLKPGATLESARADMVAIARQLEQQYPQSNTGNSVAMQTLADRVVGQQRGTVWISFGAALGVLLIACANVANLLLARAAVRSREFAVRSALGAGRGRLIRLVLTESFLLGAGGTALGLLAGLWVMQGIKTLIPAGSPFVSEVSMDPAVLAMSVLIGVGTTVLFGLVPALSGTRVNLNEALAAGGRSGSGVNARWRSVLVAGEFALTLMLLFASGLMIRTIYNLYRADLGLKTDRIVSFGYAMPGRDWQDAAKRTQLLDRALADLRTLPGVTHVALTNPLPLSGGGNQTFYLVEGETDPGAGRRPSTENNAASAAYFETMRIPLLRGRTFSDTEKSDDPATVIIDTKFAETHFAGQDPIGKRISLGLSPNGPNWSTIIGVVGHVQNYGLGQDTRVQIYFPYHRTPPTFVSFVLRTQGDPAALANSIRTTMRQVEPTLPVFGIRTMDELFDASVTNERVMLRLLAVFAGIALLLAAIGLYGVLSYIVAQRTREVGVRIALGATASDVRRLMLGQGLRLSLIGLGIGLLAATGLGKLMSSVLYGISPFDLLSLTIVSVVLLLIGLFASWLPAHRATRINPVEALRAD